MLGFIRPDIKAKFRPVWNHFHWNLGRATILLAWANVLLGVYVYHTSAYQAPLAAWMAPVAAVMGVLLIIHVVLLIMRPKPKMVPTPSGRYFWQTPDWPGSIWQPIAALGSRRSATKPLVNGDALEQGDLAGATRA